MKFSIITVCLNAVDTIEQTINSVLGQNHDDIEYIIIDGESTDGTLDIIKKYEKRIAYWSSKKDAGIYDAMNKGITKSTGDVISFINADDWYADGIIRKIDRYFELNNVDIVCGAVNYIIDNNNSTVIYSKYDLNKTYIYSACQHQAVFAKRNVFEQIGVFNTEYNLLADYEWMLRAWKERIKCLCVEDVCANFRNTGVSSYYTFDATRESMQAACNILGTEYKNEIDEFYKKKLEMTFYEQAFELNLADWNTEFILNFLDSNEYYIWGAGRVGMRCCALFEKIGIGIKGFIDNNKYDKVHEIAGYKVYNPANIDNSVKICIAVREFESQVEKQLVSMKYTKEKYILFSELVRWAVEYKMGIKYRGKQTENPDEIRA